MQRHIDYEPRMKALELAISSEGGSVPTEQVVARAAAYFSFLKTDSAQAKVTVDADGKN